MKPESLICKNCKNEFTLDVDDFSFYAKMKVPSPTWCSECQFIRRMVFRNQNALYRRTNNVTGANNQKIISIYSDDKDLTVYDREFWWGDSWDAYSYGMDIDFSKSFFEQVKELINKMPWPSLMNWNSVNSEYCNCTSDNKNCYLVFGGDYNEDCSYSTFNMHSRDSQDLYLVNKCDLCYECTDSEECYKVRFGQYNKSCSDSYFLYDCVNCTNCVGCVSLRNKSNCIYNKQYTKEEYEVLIPKIIEHMKTMPYISTMGHTYTYGEFFPNELSPFAYNETIAQEYFPKTKENIIKEGYLYRASLERDYKITLTIDHLPDHIKDVGEQITNEIIACPNKGNELTQCTTAYRITNEELHFLKQHNIALPRYCPNCRHYKRLKIHNPLKLWHRKCMKTGCINEFETTYAPERREIVYCEGCYQKEVI